ncbi:TolC family protein [Pseudomonas sp. QL9]|uniref:TolC family protein n=1 Tax=Pseudomonas sp. QL9 TaxID=3242725 RepID=UPI00352B59F3
MSNLRRRNTLDEGVAIGKSFYAISAIALAFIGLFSSNSVAGEALQKVEKRSSASVGKPASQAVGAQLEIGANAAQSPSARIVQDVRSSVPPLPVQKTAAPELVLERASVDGAVSGGVPAVSALAYGRARGTIVTGEPLSHSEVELREIFLRVVQKAAERSPAVRRALAEQSASQADIDEAKGQRLPQIDISTQSKSMEFGSGHRSEANGQALSVGINTPIFDWGRIRKTIESRSFLASAAGSALEAELEASAFDVTSNLIELGKQRIIVDISQKYVDRMAELVKMLQGIVVVDTGRVSELTQARARLLNAEASRSAAESKVRDIEISLRKMVGDSPLPALPRSTYWQLRLPELDLLLAESVVHPVVRQAQAQARSADLEAEVVRSASLPQLNWTISKSTGEDLYGRESPWQTSLNISWSAFRGGSSRAAERAARERAEAGRQNTEQQVQDLEYRVRAASQDAQAFIDRAELYRGLSLETDKVRSAFYEQWYHLGRRTLLDVLIAEADHYNNQVSEIVNRFDGYGAVMRQYASSGTLLRWLGVGRQ